MGGIDVSRYMAKEKKCGDFGHGTSVILVPLMEFGVDNEN